MIKYKIGILGTENSHASNFAKFINLPDQSGNFRYPDCRVTHVFGHYPESNQSLAEKYNIENIAQSVDEMVDRVDAVMVTARDGKYHREFAEKFIAAGKPAFIDKPFTVDTSDALALVALAKEKGVALCGGSSLKFAEGVAELKNFFANKENQVYNAALWAPVELYSRYSGFYFYASHLVETTLEIFGYDPVSITADKYQNSVLATVRYKDFCVTNNFNQHIGDYCVTYCTPSGVGHIKLDLGDCAEKECDAFINMLRTGKMHNTYEQLIMPVYYMNAVKQAFETGKTVELK